MWDFNEDATDQQGEPVYNQFYTGRISGDHFLKYNITVI